MVAGEVKATLLHQGVVQNLINNLQLSHCPDLAPCLVVLASKRIEGILWEVNSVLALM